MEEIMRKMQNMGKAQFMEETRKTRSAWVEEAVKRCNPYAPDGIRKELLQSAAIFCYVCALEPKKEAETVCKLLMNAFTMPKKDQIPVAVKFLNDRVRRLLPAIFIRTGRNAQFCHETVNKPRSGILQETDETTDSYIAGTDRI